jgi:hypothetical protein
VLPLAEPGAAAVEPVVPLVAPAVLDESGVELGVEPEVPADEEPLDGSSVPVTWTRLPTCLVSLSLSLETRR